MLSGAELSAFSLYAVPVILPKLLALVAIEFLPVSSSHLLSNFSLAQEGQQRGHAQQTWKCLIRGGETEEDVNLWSHL